MEDHLQTKWFFNRGLDTKIHLEYPQHLQGEINYYLNKEVLDLPVFEELNDNFIKALGSGILTQFAGPNDCLVYKHDPVHTIWYIKSGSMEVMDDDMVVAILGNMTMIVMSLCITCLMMTTGAGDLVGCDLDDHLDNPTRNVVTRSGFLVKALTYCEMKAIQLDHVLEVCMHWHVIQRKCGLYFKTFVVCRCTDTTRSCWTQISARGSRMTSPSM